MVVVLKNYNIIVQEPYNWIVYGVLLFLSFGGVLLNSDVTNLPSLDAFRILCELR